MPSTRFLRVGLMMGSPSDLAYRRVAAAQRVRDRHYPNWTLHLVDGHTFGLDRLRDLRVDAVIADGGLIPDSVDPCLHLAQYGSFRRPGFPAVDTDHRACGLLAATTLLATGRTSFAHLTWPFDAEHWRERQEGFAAGCGAGPIPVHAFTSFAGLGQFLSQLTLPVGLFCANDVLGQWATDVCHDLGLLVPDDVALVGVDDDIAICPLASPPLTSIAQDCDRLMTALFDQLHRHEAGQPWDELTRIPPLEVVHRRSTGSGRHTDLGERAMALIRSSPATTVAGLAQRLGVTQRSVQRALLGAYGQTPLTAIRRDRIARAKRLLASGHSIAETATLVGYTSLSAFSDTFREISGETPGSWLAEHGRG